MGTKLRIAVIIALQTLALLSMIAMRQWTLNTGTHVILETAPIDPRSLFSGDYVRLNYKISNIRVGEVSGDREFKRHDCVYVLLKEGDPYWQPVSVHHNKPTVPPGHVAIKGDVNYVNDFFWNQETQKSEKVKHINIRYGIESYFVPEGEGRALERPKEGEKITILVAVDRYGNAGIKSLLVNGKDRYTESLF
ncbi:MAG: GDYXXLXY domain-containing protein [Deltaproteobacteria bacterium]|nr:GDYXXLXY domain-containing protein [Deltaproteobacteria bacterium]